MTRASNLIKCNDGTGGKKWLSYLTTNVDLDAWNKQYCIRSNLQCQQQLQVLELGRWDSCWPRHYSPKQVVRTSGRDSGV